MMTIARREESETEERAAWDEKVDEYIDSLRWDGPVDNRTKRTVENRLREFAVWIRKELMD